MKTAGQALSLKGDKNQILCHSVPTHVRAQHFPLQIQNVNPKVPCTEYHNIPVRVSVLEYTRGAAPYPLGELHVLGHDSHPLGVDGAKHSVLKQGGEVSLSRLLKSQNGNSLEPAAGFSYLNK